MTLSQQLSQVGKSPVVRFYPRKRRSIKRKKSTRGRDKREQEKLAGDIDYILKDDIPAAETKGQIWSGTVSTSLKAQRVKEYFIREKHISDEEKLADDIEYILNDYVPAVKSKENVSPGTVLSSKKARSARKIPQGRKT